MFTCPFGINFEAILMINHENVLSD